MWPIYFAIAAYCAAEGYRQAKEENRSNNQKRLPGGNSRQRIADARHYELTDGYDDDYDDEDDF